MTELLIPEAAVRDENAVEMLRVWIAEGQLWCAINIGMYGGNANISESNAWGIVLADAVRHIAKALESGFRADPDETIADIRASLLAELAKPTSHASGEFANRPQSH